MATLSSSSSVELVDPRVDKILDLYKTTCKDWDYVLFDLKVAYVRVPCKLYGLNAHVKRVVDTFAQQFVNSAQVYSQFLSPSPTKHVQGVEFWHRLDTIGRPLAAVSHVMMNWTYSARKRNWVQYPALNLFFLKSSDVPPLLLQLPPPSRLVQNLDTVKDPETLLWIKLRGRLDMYFKMKCDSPKDIDTGVKNVAKSFAATPATTTTTTTSLRAPRALPRAVALDKRKKTLVAKPSDEDTVDITTTTPIATTVSSPRALMETEEENKDDQENSDEEEAEEANDWAWTLVEAPKQSGTHEKMAASRHIVLIVRPNTDPDRWEGVCIDSCFKDDPAEGAYPNSPWVQHVGSNLSRLTKSRLHSTYAHLSPRDLTFVLLRVLNGQMNFNRRNRPFAMRSAPPSDIVQFGVSQCIPAFRFLSQFGVMISSTGKIHDQVGKWEATCDEDPITSPDHPFIAHNWRSARTKIDPVSPPATGIRVVSPSSSSSSSAPVSKDMKDVIMEPAATAVAIPRINGHDASDDVVMTPLPLSNPPPESAVAAPPAAPPPTTSVPKPILLSNRSQSEPQMKSVVSSEDKVDKNREKSTAASSTSSASTTMNPPPPRGPKRPVAQKSDVFPMRLGRSILLPMDTSKTWTGLEDAMKNYVRDNRYRVRRMVLLHKKEKTYEVDEYEEIPGIDQQIIWSALYYAYANKSKVENDTVVATLPASSSHAGSGEWKIVVTNAKQWQSVSWPQTTKDWKDLHGVTVNGRPLRMVCKETMSLSLQHVPPQGNVAVVVGNVPLCDRSHLLLPMFSDHSDLAICFGQAHHVLAAWRIVTIVNAKSLALSAEHSTGIAASTSAPVVGSSSSTVASLSFPNSTVSTVSSSTAAAVVPACAFLPISSLAALELTKVREKLGDATNAVKFRVPVDYTDLQKAHLSRWPTMNLVDNVMSSASSASSSSSSSYTLGIITSLSVTPEVKAKALMDLNLVTTMASRQPMHMYYAAILQHLPPSASI